MRRSGRGATGWLPIKISIEQFDVSSTLPWLSWTATSAVSALPERTNKGAMSKTIPPILNRLASDSEAWVKAFRRGRRRLYHLAMGRASAIRNAVANFGKAFFKQLQQARQRFPDSGYRTCPESTDPTTSPDPGRSPPRVYHCSPGAVTCLTRTKYLQIITESLARTGQPTVV